MRSPPAEGRGSLVLKSSGDQQLSMDAWSPDGRSILYHSDTDVTRRLWALPMDGDRKPFIVYEPPGGAVAEPSFFTRWKMGRIQFQ